MNIELLEENLHLTHRQIAEKFSKGETTIRYWLKKYGLSVNRPAGPRPKTAIIVRDGLRSCSQCGELKPVDEFYKKSTTLTHAACKYCMNGNTVLRQREFKSQCVEYKGGKCVVCKYDRYQGSFDFHHLDPTQKDFNISKVKTKKFNDEIKAELDKCALLCATCHREVHGGIIDLKMNITIL